MATKWQKNRLFRKENWKYYTMRLGFSKHDFLNLLFSSFTEGIRKGIISLSFSIAILLFLHLSAQDTHITDARGTPVPEFLLKKISIEVQDSSIREALIIYSERTKFYLNYNENIIPTDRHISISVKDVPVITVLQKILERTGIDFIISKSGQIVLVRSKTKIVDPNYTVSGFVSDAESGEALIGTNIYIETLNLGCSSNVYGFYSLTLPAGKYTLFYSYMGYEIKKIEIQLNQDIRQNVELKTMALSGDPLEVTADAEENMVSNTEIGTIKFSPKELTSMPALFGEQDILKSLHFLPGVTLSREGDSGFNVRGGNSDQNLVLLDEAPVYNAFHFFGFFSVFNSDAIRDVKLIKGSAPPKYGGKLSSVLDIQMKEGNLKEFHVNGGIGTIFSRLTLEGPIVKDKSSFILSGRRTYADVFTRLFAKGDVQRSTLYFYDLNLKANYRINDTDRLYLSGYFGRDALGFSGVFRNHWGNRTATLRWNHLVNNKLFLNSSLIYSKFDYSMKVEPEEDSPEDGTVEIKNNIDAFTIKEDFQYFLDAQNTFNFGLEYIFYRFLPGHVSASGKSAFDVVTGRQKAQDGALYVAHEFEATDRLKLNYGLRYSRFSINRKGDSYNFTDIEDLPEFEFRGKEHVTYQGLEPRITANYRLTGSSSVKIGFSRNYQNIHMLSNSTAGTPIDVWQPSSQRVKPQIADQISLGYFRNFGNNNFNFSAEIFYKDMKNQVDFKNGANIVLSTLFETDLTFGIGRAYGIEFLLKRKTGKLSGWIGYSLAKAERKFDDINQGNPFPPKFDRTHDFSLVMLYQLNHHWKFSANWVYFTGNAVTIPFGKYEVNGQIIEAYTERNAFRMMAYHRLDISFTYTAQNGNFWNLSLYNAYGRRNAYALLFRDGEDNPLRLALFSFVPSISYNFKF
jgi:hypothetical protein